MKTNAQVVTIIAPKRYYAPADRKRKIVIADRGQLKIKQLRRLLEAQELSKSKAPDERLIVKVPDIIIYELAYAHERMGKKIGSLNKALNRKSKEITELQNQLSDQNELVCEAVAYHTVFDFVLGALTEIIDAANELKKKVNEGEYVIPIVEYAALLNTADEATQLLDDLTTEEPDEAEEEEKDDRG